MDTLLQNSLLERVRDEVAMKEGDQEAGLGGLVGWGAKETDIYKVSLSFNVPILRRREWGASLLHEEFLLGRGTS